jgi:hypothetical protein
MKAPASLSPSKISLFSSPRRQGCLVVSVLLAALLAWPAWAFAGLWYSETKGPFKNLTQVVDLDQDGDLDIVISHTRWEDTARSWAGVGLWINQGAGKFERLGVLEADPNPKFAAGAGDVDQDGDADLLVLGYEVRLLENRGGAQGGRAGEFWPANSRMSSGSPSTGYGDMGGSIVMGDLNGDGRVDAFVAGCCYGLNTAGPGDGFTYDPSVAWVWINHGNVGGLQTGQTMRLKALDGLPIRQAALGDLDGDGDLDVVAAVGQPTMGNTDALGDLILLNDGTGRLAASGQRLGDTDSSSVALGDVNADGRLDALIGTGAGARLWLNQGGGAGGLLFTPAGETFAARQTLGGGLGAAYSWLAKKALGFELAYGSLQTKGVFLSDLDGDGDLDALIARVWGAEIWRNDGQGGFTRSGVRFACDQDSGVAVGDFDGDGDPDVFAGGNASRYQVWLNDGRW